MPANWPNRRSRQLPGFLALAFSLATATGWAGEHASFGPVQPAVAVPNVWAENEVGQRLRLRPLLEGRRTAVQFVFVNCQLACPMLGSLFQRVQKELGPTPANLVTITVDPANDTPQRLRQWKATFHGGPQWHVLRLAPADLRRVLRAFGQKPGPAPNHTLQIFLVDAQGRYAARTTEMPLAATVADALSTGGQLRAGVPRPTEPSTREAASSPASPAMANPSHPADIAALGLSGEQLFAFSGWQATVGGEALSGQAARCAGCHAAAARAEKPPTGSNAKEGGVTAPPLQANWLTQRHARRGGPPSQYTADSFCESLRTGVDAAGVQFAALMPRYRMDSRSCRTLWLFLTQPAQ